MADLRRLSRDPIMWRVGVLGLEEFRVVAEYLEGKVGSEAEDHDGIFVVTLAGVEEVTS